MQASNLSIVCWQTLIASLSHARIIRNHHGQQSYKQTAVVAHVSAAWSRPGLLEQLGDFCSQSDGVYFCCESDGVDFCSQSDGIDFCSQSDGVDFCSQSDGVDCCSQSLPPERASAFAC